MPATPQLAASSPSPPLPSVSGHLDPGSHQRVLMKTGLILLIIGHLNFITGALVHGTVLRFVVNPRDAISLQYAVANAASVISALLVPRGAGWEGTGGDGTSVGVGGHLGWMQGGQEVGCRRGWDGCGVDAERAGGGMQDGRCSLSSLPCSK